MVVTRATAVRRAHLPAGTMIVLGGLTLLQTELGAVVPLARAQDGRRFELLRTPGLGLPQTSPDGDFASPVGAPRSNMWFATGSLNPDMPIFANRDHTGLSALSRPPRRSVNSSVSPAFGSSDLAADPDESEEGGMGGAGTVSDGGGRPVARRIAPGCFENDVENALQGGGEFWSGQARSVVPAAFPGNVFTGNPHGAADPLALGPTGHPINLPATGPAGGWCRPPLTPMSQSSPLGTRAFWILLLFPTAMLFVFGLSRGFRLRGITHTHR